MVEALVAAAYVYALLVLIKSKVSQPANWQARGTGDGASPHPLRTGL